MKIIQSKKDGSGFIHFTQDEIAIINEKKGIYLNSIGLRQFSNQSVKLAVDVNEQIPEENRITSFENEHIERGGDGATVVYFN